MTQGFLQEYDHVARDNRRGRNPYEGYQRGSGIKIGGLQEKLWQEPDFILAYRLVEGRTIVSHLRLMNLYLLIRFFLPRLERGHIIEFGSYRGGSAMFMAYLAAIHLPGVQVYALDTYEGMPPTDRTIDAHQQGEFGETNYDEVVAAKNAAGLDNLHIVRGLFADTTPGVLAQCGSLALAHIDCDIYDAALYAWNVCKPAMVPGGYIAFDDATECNCLGAMEAIEDIVVQDGLRAEQVDPHFVYRYPPLARGAEERSEPQASRGNNVSPLRRIAALWK